MIAGGADERERGTAPMLDPDLLELLRCPLTQQRLQLVVDEGGASWLRREDGTAKYPIRSGIPVLLKEEAVPDADA